ncbi:MULTISPECIES: prenyltransferase [Alteromonadaceae]|uniref:Prenyltransferase n=1 Tax=Brumicola blandensis TaxID=3075611 RepID=A0AAW8R3U9_9ALTE|nr:MULTISPECIES: prenyltransferase [unclassified Alteromonas]MDT0582525.1 prenyltransferase [Alteromonas sp. W409]MDT0628746.1 prenyltransferase [Alteromonas sp. W364]
MNHVGKAQTQSFSTAVFATMRLPFLVLTPACLLVPFALANYHHEPRSYLLMVLITAGALCAHIAVNMFNEYTDFVSGLDLKTKRTSFSGGSGGLPNEPKAKDTVLILAIINLCICIGIGLYLVTQVGPELLSIGVVGVLIIISYTKWINRFPFICLIAPGFAFGVLIINGSYFVLSETFRLDVLFVSLIIFFQTNNLLLLNQIPDIQADKQHGRNHIAIQYGLSKAINAHTTMALLSLVCLFAAVMLAFLPYLSLLALFPIVLSLVISFQLQKIKTDPEMATLLPLMGKNVLVTISTPVILSLTLIFS